VTPLVELVRRSMGAQNARRAMRSDRSPPTKEQGMSYIDGFVIAVPTANRDKFIDHAKHFDALFIEQGATRIVEAWGDDVKAGKWTDFRRAVDAKDDETIAFSWVEWPDKATRDAAMSKMEEMMKTDSRFDPAKNPMPFDGKRMIFGGFVPVVELGVKT
jgi:uncharacterized protein YbaA (DUF1428 family)